MPKEERDEGKFAKAKQNAVIDLDFDDVMTPAEKQSEKQIFVTRHKKAKISTRFTANMMEKAPRAI